MLRHLAKLICLAAAAAGGYVVHGELAEVFGEWVPAAGGAITGVVIWPLTYFPLLRPLADLIHDRASALNQRVRATRAGTGLDEVPERLPDDFTAPRITRCGICGGPGGPVCGACHERMAGR